MLSNIIVIILFVIAFVVGCFVGIKAGVVYTLDKVEKELKLGSDWKNVLKN